MIYLKPLSIGQIVRRGLLIGVFVALLAGTTLVVPANAQANDPWNSASTIRRLLFSAQTSLLAGDAASAIEQTKTAQSTFQQTLRAQLSADAPDSATAIDSAFNAALAKVQIADSPGLAVARSRIWSGLVHASSLIVVKALQEGDRTTAQAWLQLRDFRTPTKFSRPGTDSTLAIKSLIEGQGSYPDTLLAVRADLLDTYQSKLNEALIAADSAHQQGFTMKAAEQSALAAGYFDLITDQSLSQVYLAQHGAEGLKASQTKFSRLVQASLGNDSERYEAVRTSVDDALKGFRAAPLSGAEQARRAGQLAQFVSLVSVEYGRGVADGRVIRDIEIQEALTFHEGANAAFADLQTMLEARDASATAQVGSLLGTLKLQITATADPRQVDSTVAAISKLLTSLYPASWQTINTGSDFDVISTILDQIEPAVKQGAYNQAESARLQAYAVLDSGIEQKLRGFAPDLALRVESLFWQGDGTHTGMAVLLTSNAPLDEVKTGLATLRSVLAEAQTFLNDAKAAPAVVVGNAAIIVFREGLEAVLILASLIASMRSDDARKYRRAMMIGAGLALLATALTWWIANGLLMSMIHYGEKLSVVVGVIAIAVLLLITNWFFHKNYWTGWMANFHKQKGRILAGTFVIGPSIGLVILGFTSIYREGFETVLFLQSLVLDSGLTIVLEGVLIGLLATVVVGMIVFVMQVRLPARQMFIVTGILIGVVLITVVGNTVHAMQSVGWMPITPIASLYIPYWMGQWFGLFATWQNVGLQFAAAAFVIGSYYLAEHFNEQKRTRQANSSKTPEKAIAR